MKVHSEFDYKPLKERVSYRLALSSIISDVFRWFESLILLIFLGRKNLYAGYEKIFNELILEEQTECHKRNNNLFFWVKHGDLNTLKEKIREHVLDKNCSEEKLIDERDAAGANIVHLAYLLENYKIGRWLVEVYPFIALKPYASTLPTEAIQNKPELKELMDIEKLMPYTGETILHMVIVRNNYEEVRWLLDFYKDHKDSVPSGLVRLLTSNATGRFFNQNGSFYYGGYPLQFAVCSNNIEIFDLVLSFTSSLAKDGVDDSHESHEEGINFTLLKDLQSLGPNVIFMRDAFGNTVLHLCVIHGLQEMYRHVYRTAEVILKREIKLLYAQTIAPNKSKGPFELQDLRILEKHDGICMGYNFIPKKLKKPQADKFEEWINYEARIKVEERLVLALNMDYHSPLTLAAARMSGTDNPDVAARKVEMFKFLLDMHKKVLYEYGIVNFTEIGLLGLEIEYDYKHYDIPASQRHNIRSAIDWMCIRGAEQAMVIPDVRKIVEKKWRRLGLSFFLFEFILTIVVVLCVTLISIFINFTPSTSPDDLTTTVVSILYLFVWIVYLASLFSEILAFCRNTSKYLRISGVPVFHVICKSLNIVSFGLFCLFRFSQQANYVAVKFFLAITLLASWISIYYYLMAFESTGPFMLTLARIVGMEIPNFLKFYVIVIVAFSCGLTLLADNGDCGSFFGFSSMFKTIWVLVQDTLHPEIPASLDISSIDNVNQSLQWANNLLITAYYGSVNIVMLNILIAIINATYSFYTAFNDVSNTFNNEAVLLIAKYNILQYMECFDRESAADHRRRHYCIVETLDRDFSPFDATEGGRMSLKDFSSHKDHSVASQYTEYLFEMQEETDYWAQVEENDVKRKAQNVTVLIICPQMDFLRGGAFPIDGANEDCKRTAAMIRTNVTLIHNIIVILESRYEYNISHSLFWLGKNGLPPKPFTTISYLDIMKKVWLPRDNSIEVVNWCLAYTKALEQRCNRVLTIWPDHCIIGSRGHVVDSAINEALQEWAVHSHRPVVYVTKGQNWKTEMLSALEAEIVDPLDYSTALNSELLSILRMSDKLIVCGQALSHAVNFTMRDLLKHWRGDMSQIVFLEDGCSPIVQPTSLKLPRDQQYLNIVKELMEDLKLEGVTIATTNTAFPIYFEDTHAKRKLKRAATMNSLDLDGVAVQGDSIHLRDEIEHLIRNPFMRWVVHCSRKSFHLANRTLNRLLFSVLKVDRYDSRIVFNETIAAKETELLHDEKSLFYWVLQGRLSDLKPKVRSVFKHDPSGQEIYKTDATGATIIHKAYLLKFYEMGHWLVELFPELALRGYSDKLVDSLEGDFTPSEMPYTGLTILHLVILRKDYDEVRWLLDFYKDHKYSVEHGLEKLLAANVTGSFFSSSGEFYFGGYPLQFAVCSNSIEIFDLVLSYASSIDPPAAVTDGEHTAPSETSSSNELLSLGPNVIFMRDSVGNTVVHLCAIHGLKAMFQHVCKMAETIISRELKLIYSNNIGKGKKKSRNINITSIVDVVNNGYKLISPKLHIPQPDKYEDWLLDETKKKLDERLLFALNKDLHSPLTLAASVTRKPGDKRDNIFGDLLAYYKKPLWKYGPILCSNMELEGVETSYNMLRFVPEVSASAFGVRSESAIRWLCISESESCIELPDVKALIATKWLSFGLPLFLLDAILDCTLTLLVSLLLVFVDFCPTADPKDSIDWFINILYALSFVLFAAIFVTECDVIIRHHTRYMRVQGTARFHMLCKAVKILSYFIFFGFQLADGTVTKQSRSADADSFNGALESPQDNRAVKISLSVCAMASWLHGFYYLLGFEKTGPFLLVLSRIVVSDLPNFFQFFIFVLLGFSCSIAMVSNSGSPDPVFGFVRLLEATVGLIQKTVNIAPFEIYPARVIGLDDIAYDLGWLQDLQVTLFYSVVILVLLNLLIALMSKTYSTYSSYNEAFFLMEKYQIMEYLEMHMDAAELNVSKKAFSNKKKLEYETEDDLLSVYTYSFEMREIMSDWLSCSSQIDAKQYRKTSLFIIDPQVDFHPGGSLAVPGADKDSLKIANMIKKNKHFIHEIFVSMDSHYPCHIAHAVFWVNSDGKHPDPFTVIRYVDIKNGVWRPQEDTAEMMDWCLEYVKALERKGRMKLTIWPQHCIIGSKGHCIVPAINEALQEWAAYSHRPVTYIMKGQNCRTEMYSALEAEVVDPLDQSTALNNEVLSLLRVADRLLVCGQAMSHCVNFTFRDIVKHWRGDLCRLELLEDGSSCVAGFAQVGKTLIRDMKELGVTVSTIDTAFPRIEDSNTPEEEVESFTEIEELDNIEDLNQTLQEESVKQANTFLDREPSSTRSRKPDSNDGVAFSLSLYGRLKVMLGEMVLKRLNSANSGKARDFSDEIVKLQAKQHSDPNKIFHWIQSGDLTALKEKIAEDPTLDIGEHDAAGANIVHLAYLYEFYHIGHWLVESYPDLALKPYSDNVPEEFADMGFTEGMMPYTGENILHIVIVRRNYKEVRWLLDFFKDHKDSVPYGLAKLLMSNANGNFFDPSGEFYFGGYPLQFAVCSNSQEIFDLVLSFASSVEADQVRSEEVEDRQTEGGTPLVLGPSVIFMRDSYGNTMLHLCVIHGLTDMFEHVLSIASTILKRDIQLSYSNKASEEVHNTDTFYLPEIEHASGYNLPESSLRLPEPDRYETWVLSEARQKIDERLLLVLNNHKLSPLTLAASLSNKVTSTVSKERRSQMMKTVMVSTNTKILLWRYGPIACHDVNLKGVDIDYDLSEYESFVETTSNTENLSAINWLCINEDTDLIQMSEIKAIIDRKWERYGLPLFVLDCLLDGVITTLMTLIAIFVDVSFTVRPHFGFEWFVNCLYVLTFIIFCSLAHSEIITAIRNPQYLISTRGVATVNLICREVKIVTFFAFMICRLIEASSRDWRNTLILRSVSGDRKLSHVYPTYWDETPTSFPTGSNTPTSYPTSIPSFQYNPQDYPGSKITLSICVVTCWFNLYYYMMGFKKTGPFMLTFKRVVVHDLPYFLQFFFIPLIGFALCISMLENDGTVEKNYAFWNTARTVWALIQKAVTVNVFIDTTDLTLVPNNLQWLSNLLLTTFYFFEVLIMLNLLIAIINDTYALWSSCDESIFLIEKCNIMDFFDKQLGAEQLMIQREKFCNVKTLKKEMSRSSHSLDIRGSEQSNTTQIFTMEMMEIEPEWCAVISDTTMNSRLQKTSLFIIDPQVDFHPGGSLAVPGANEDSERIAAMIKKNKHFIHEIFVSMDSHYPNHIAHAVFWINKEGKHPEPFTEIRYADVKDGVWRPQEDTPDMIQWCLRYTKALERKGRVKLIIWPQHCIIGSKGHCIVPVINDALQEWAAHSHRPVTYIMKGQNCRTEMYSALEAEVVDPLDHTTALNSDLLSMLRVAERILICGQALSHCVNFTVRDIVKHWKGEMSKIVLLTDGSSPVPTFERAANLCIFEMMQEGVLVSTTLAAFEDKALFPSKVVETNSDDDDDQSLPDQAEVVSFDESEMGGPEMKSSSEEKEEHHQQVAKIERKDVVFGDEANEEIHAYILGEAENETPRTSAMSWLSLQNKFGDFLLKSLNITHNYSYKKFLDTLSSMNVSIHNDKQKLFYYIEMGDLHNLKEQLQLCFRDCTTAVERKRFLKRYVDAVGANIVHLAYLIENYDLAHWLVETFPEVALEPYSDQLPKFIGEEFEGFEMPYSGENILHMVIVRRNYVEVRWLLDFYKDHKDSVPNGLKTLLVANATGKFFDISGEFYFGGYPLQFAVCSNSIDIFDLVLSFASSLEVDSGEDQLEEDGASTLLGADVPSLGPNVIFMRDTNGNTVLHLCVMHGLQDMFEHVYKVAETIISREIKLVYSQLYDTDGDQHVALESFEETSAITTGYGLKPKMLKIPSDEKKYDEWVKAETFAKLQERLLLVLNHDLHSPLTLAAVIKETDSASKKARKLSMLTYLLKKLKTTLWTFGKEQCAEVALEGLEVKYDLSDYVIPAGRQLPRYHSVLSWLCIHDVEPAIMIPEIRRIIETKWERCGLPCYIKSFVLDFVIVILLSLVLLYGNYTPTRSTEFAIYWFVNIIYALIIAIFAVLVFTELFHIIRFRKIFRHVRGIAQFHIACRSAEMLSFTVFCISKFARMQSGQITRCNYGDTELHTEDFVDIKIPLIICVMTSWIHLYYYLMGFQRTGLFVLTLSRIIARDVPHFLRFFVICLFAFACAISLLGNTGNYHTHFAFWRFLKTIWSLIQEAVNLPTIDDQTLLTLVPIDLQWLSDIWNTLFYYTGAYVMVNLLIAIINETYAFYTKFNEETQGFNNEAILLIEKFNVMDYIEHHLSREELQAYRDKYAMAKPVELDFADCSTRQSLRTAKVDKSKLKAKQNSSKNCTKKFKYYFQFTDQIPDWQAAAPATHSLHHKACLLLINPQNDFHLDGSFELPGADKDSAIISRMIRANKNEIHDIIVTLLSKNSNHISHGDFWVDKDGLPAPTGTVISCEALRAGEWRPRDSSQEKWCLKYARALADEGKQLVIHSKHCVAGGRGQAVTADVNEALQDWASSSRRPLTYVMTGQNHRTDMFSALKAEVEDPLDSSTGLNAELLSMLRISEKLVICGSVSSQYVTSTVKDILKYWRGDTAKIVFLENDPSAKRLLDFDANAFLDYLSKEGIKVLNVESIFHPPDIGTLLPEDMNS